MSEQPDEGPAFDDVVHVLDEDVDGDIVEPEDVEDDA